jgi:S1-C subfamily serine protease
VAAVARAASIVIRVAPDRGLGNDGTLEDEVESEETQRGEPGDRSDGLARRRERTLAAGIIVDPKGIAVTSARAMLLAPSFTVALADGTPLQATLLALDRRTDVAVLKLDNSADVLPHLPLGNSERLQVGEWVIAVGAPEGLEGTVTAGVITALPGPSTSPLASFLQTDAVTGRRTAGAAIVNLRGEVVGLATVLSGDGIGYALPSNTLRRVYLELLEKGRVSRPWLGVRTQSLTDDLARALGARDRSGVLVADVLPRGPAAGAGVRSGDIVLEVDARPVSSRAQLERAVNSLAPGQRVKLRVRREGREIVASMRVAEEPDDWAVPPGLARARALLGVEVHPITPTMGAVVARVEAWSPAGDVGLEAGDVIREVNRHAIRNLDDFETAARSLVPGAPLLLLVQRGDIALYTTLRSRE